MALTEAQVTAAKADVKEFLEYSIQVLCLSLGMDPAEASSSFAIPVDDTHLAYTAYQSVVEQATALEALA